jgi:hypothetical protein
MIRCIPCPAPVRHVARVVHRHVLRPIGRHVHHVWHHVPRVIAYGCCAAAVGGMGAAIVAPPGGYFPQTPEAAPATYAQAPQGWPETPAYSGIGGGGVVLIPTYSNAHPALLSVPPNVLRGTPPATTHTTNVPEPSTFALLLLPVVALPVLRRIV